MKTRRRPRKVLIVCYANRCRSPMAEAILRDVIDKDPKLSKLGIEVDSAAMDGRFRGDQPVDGAIREMSRLGLDISAHKSTPVDDLVLSEYGLILTMEQNQRDAISAKHARLADRVFTISSYIELSGDISDPIYTDKYADCADQLLRCVIAVAEKLRGELSDSNRSRT